MERISQTAPIDLHLLQEVDAMIAVEAPENTRNMSAIDAERLNALQVAYRPALERFFGGEISWTGGQFPTPALAQEAGMGTDEFADFLYGACLLDWDTTWARRSTWSRTSRARRATAWRRTRRSRTPGSPARWAGSCRLGEGRGIPGVAVKCVEIGRNTRGEGGDLDKY